MANLTYLVRTKWVALGTAGFLIAGVLLPWTHGYSLPAKFIPPGYNPYHNGLDELNAGAGQVILAGSLLGLPLRWLATGRSPLHLRLLAGLIQAGLCGLMLFMVKLHSDDFDYFFGFTVLPGFWLTLAALLAWTVLGLATLLELLNEAGRHLRYGRT